MDPIAKLYSPSQPSLTTTHGKVGKCYCHFAEEAQNSSESDLHQGFQGQVEVLPLVRPFNVYNINGQQI